LNLDTNFYFQAKCKLNNETDLFFSLSNCFLLGLYSKQLTSALLYMVLSRIRLVYQSVFLWTKAMEVYLIFFLAYAFC